MKVIDDSTDFREYMQKPPEAAKVKPASDWCDAVIDRFHGEQKLSGITLPWGKTHTDIRLRPGETSIWPGINGHGKSMVVSQVMLGAMAQGERVCIASMEMKPAATMARMSRQAAGCAEPAVQFIRQFHTRTDGKLWLYDQQGTVKPDRMIALMRYCSDKLGVTQFVIDSLMKCGIGSDDYNRQKSFVDEVTSVGRDTGMHVHLVAHSRKSQDEFSQPGKFDVKGASEITDQVDNVFSFWRNKRKEVASVKHAPDQKIMEQSDALLICDKQRHGEWEGKVALWFHQPSFQFVGAPGARPIDFLRGSAE